MSPEQMLILIALLEPWRKGGPWPGVGELVKATGLARAKLVEAIDQLEDSRWIRREIDRTELEQPDRQRAEDLQREALAARPAREPQLASWKRLRKRAP